MLGGLSGFIHKTFLIISLAIPLRDHRTNLGRHLRRPRKMQWTWSMACRVKDRKGVHGNGHGLLLLPPLSTVLHLLLVGEWDPVKVLLRFVITSSVFLLLLIISFVLLFIIVTFLR